MVMDFYFHYRNPNNLHSSSVVITSNKTFHGRSSSQVAAAAAGEKKRNQKRSNNNGLQINAGTAGGKVKLSTDPQSVAARERRHRISDKLKILRSMIPGADTKNMDTVSMLEEAIQYVKHLKSQIWLHQTTFISFEQNYNNNNNHDDDDNSQYYWPNQADHQLFTFDHGDYYYHHHQLSSSCLPKMEKFSDGSSCLKDDIGSLHHDHHHLQHVMYP